MKLLTPITLATSLAIALTTAANAVPLPTLAPGSTTTDPLGIDNLVVDGTIYDVTFSTTTLNTFTEGSALSVDANAALISALDQLSVTALGNSSPPNEYLLDVDNTLSVWNGAACLVTCTAGSWIKATGLGFGNLGTDGVTYVEAADFTAVGTIGVPEPLTLSLFGAGILGAAAMRRRKAK